jgi:hypothetical protein
MWAFFMFLGFLLIVHRRRWPDLWRIAPGSVAACLLGLSALAGYYAWTMTLNAKPAMVGTTTPQTVVFILYELLGAVGLGPGRYDLRATGVKALLPHIGILSLFAVGIGWSLAQGFAELVARFGAKRVAWVTAAVLAPFALLCIVGVATRFRVLGRHMTPLLPVLWVVLVFGLGRLWNSNRRSGKVLVVFFFALNLFSCVNVRFAYRHQKDDYRRAATLAKSAAAAGEFVWWSADRTAARYYGLNDSKAQTANPVVFLLNSADDELLRLPQPTVVIISKPDTYDAYHAVSRYVRTHGYRISTTFPAFYIWVKPN